MRKLQPSLILSFLVGLPAYAAQINNADVGDVAASFLQINPSVRASALGGAQATLRGGMDAMYSNPASMSAASSPELFLSHNQSFIDTT